MDTADLARAAQKTCVQCKLSKKKCDKLLPSCSRCSRLSIDCIYSKPEELAASHATPNGDDTRFAEVFRRLEKIETHIFAPTIALQERNVEESSIGDIGTGQSQISPEHSSLDYDPLDPSHMASFLRQSLQRMMIDAETSVKAIIENFLRRVNRWLLLFPASKFDPRYVNLDGMKLNEDCSILIFAMHLVATPQRDTSCYRACKYHFGQYAVLGQPSIALIQAGLLVALFEHLQCVENRALITLGICTSLSNAIELNSKISEPLIANQDKITQEREEAMLTWWAILRLERYFNMSPAAIPKQSIISHTQKTGPQITNVSSFDTISGHDTIIEVEAGRLLGQVQSLIRSNMESKSQDFYDTANTIFNEISSYQNILKIRFRQSGSRAGIAVGLSALLQLQWFICRSTDVFNDCEKLLRLHTLLDESRTAVGYCRGVDEDDPEVIQPFWISIAYQCISTYLGLRSIEVVFEVPEIDISPFLNLLVALKDRYKLAEQCLHLLESEPSYIHANTR